LKSARTLFLIILIQRILRSEHRWALESLKFHDPSQALYGIIQGSEFEDLRRESSRFILKQGFDGIAVGGSLGKTREEMYKILG
jgi:tRNA-guanine family transglycosylase